MVSVPWQSYLVLHLLVLFILFYVDQAEVKLEKMEQFFTALLKQKETSDVSDAFWEERLKMLKENCGFSDAAHRNYIMKRVNQLQVRASLLLLLF